MDALPENRTLDEIDSYFATKGIAVRVHTDAPPEPAEDELRRMSSDLKRAMKTEPMRTHWADLVNSDGMVIAPRYGSGFTPEEALRGAAQRWRIEQVGIDNQRKPGEPLP